MRPLFDKKARVMYRDTDSLFYEIETDDIYKNLAQVNHILDLSDYPKNHHLHIVLSKKVSLKISDELNGDIVLEAVFSETKSLLCKNKANSQTKSQRCEQTFEKDTSF